jgi:hypothetical protein
MAKLRIVHRRISGNPLSAISWFPAIGSDKD